MDRAAPLQATRGENACSKMCAESIAMRREDMIQNGAVKSLSPEQRLAQPRSGHILGELGSHDVPAEGVALDGHASFERPVHDLVALSEIVHPLQNGKTRAKSQVAAQRSRASISSTPGRV